MDIAVNQVLRELGIEQGIVPNNVDRARRLRVTRRTERATRAVTRSTTFREQGQIEPRLLCRFDLLHRRISGIDRDFLAHLFWSLGEFDRENAIT